MKSILNHRNLFVVLVFLAVVGMMGTALGREIFPEANYPAFGEPNYAERPEYVENEIIVKFRGSSAETMEMGVAKGIAAQELRLSDSLDKLNKRYKLKKARPLFKNFKANRERVKGLLSKDETQLSKKERHILRGLKQAPKNARVPDLSRIYKIKLKLEEGQSLEEAVAAYNNHPDVEYAELNYIVSIHNKPNDLCYPLQWPLNNTGQMYPESGRYNPPPGTPDCDIDAPEAWDIFTGSSEVIIAVVDTGVDYNHRDLQGNMWTDSNGFYGYDFINGDNDPMDDHGHGTHCSGIIAAEGNNGLDITGVCWNGKIMSVKILSANGSGNTIDAIRAFYYAVENGADVISNSWGGGSYSETMQEVITYAYSQGVVMVAAAGNDYSSDPSYPAHYEHMISVAATNSNDEKASFSNYGGWVDIAAPGVDVLSLRANGTSMGTPYDAYTTIASGTSMACPHVAGVCALLMSIYPEIQVDELEQALLDSTDAISPEICASGRLNAYQALLQTVNPQGRVALDSKVYPCSAIIGIALFDSDLKGQGTYEVTIDTNGGDLETVPLSETASAVGVFTGTIATTSGDLCVEDGTVQVSHGEIITVTYEDANDGTGNPVTITDTAIVDCESPEISNVHITLPGREPRIRFETDEPTTARVLCGLACGGPYTIERKGFILTTHHAVKLVELSPETEYFFIIEANDVAGNGTIDTNDGDCYSFTTIAASSKIYVPGQCPTIQEAIDNCWDGMTVWVADGIYTGVGKRDIDFKGKAITVKSENGPENCIIDCNGTEAESHRGFYFHSGEDANSVLAGFTITNGYVSGSWYIGIGGAIFCEYNSSPTITNCIITGNLAGWDGGGINNINSSPTITNCTFTSNSAIGNDGGGINNESSSPIINNCTFSGNSAYDWGGAIRNIYFCSPTITNCTFSGNSADDGGAMFYYHECTPTITNCTFAGNSARNGNTLACDSRWQEYPSDVQMTNCIIWDGGDEISNNDTSTIAIIYSDVQGGWPDEGNIDSDPCFVEPGYLGPVSYWKFDEASGTTAHDSVGDNHGTLINGPTWTTGQVAAALSFDGMDDCVDVPDFPDLNPQVFTVEAWIKTSATYYFETFGTILVKGRVFDENYGLFVYESGWVRWQYTSGGVWGDTSKYEFLDSSKVVNDDQFHHIVGTYDGEELKLYIDGSLDSSRAETKVPDKNNLSLRIGRRNNPGDLPWHSVVPFDGLIDEVAIYDRVLSDDEIQQHYQNGSSGQAYPDAVKPDYRLLSGSPCINTGDPNYIPEPDETDLDGNPRVIGGRIDMGVYEFNHIPVADAGQDRTVEAQAPWGATVTLDASGSSDADSTPGTNDDINDFNWYKLDPCDPNADVFLGSGQILDCNLSIGEHIIVLEVIDRIGAFSTKEVTITVQDTTPPEFEFSVAPTMLWPPDHKMYEITPSWTVSDECDASPDVSLVSIVANEGDDTIGDGHTSNDIQIGEDGSIYLRSERSGTSDDRVYTITYQAVDDCGNATVRSAIVSIPHDFKVLARIAARWLWAGPGNIPEDLNGDGVVNLKDIAIFANNWIQ